MLPDGEAFDPDRGSDIHGDVFDPGVRRTPMAPGKKRVKCRGRSLDNDLDGCV